ncbi:hypothetical protein LINPERHAP1_LOCUS8830, partial [Linum perenne]
MDFLLLLYLQIANRHSSFRQSSWIYKAYKPYSVQAGGQNSEALRYPAHHKP